jgi:flagellar hook-basal body complex protein FliE
MTIGALDRLGPAPAALPPPAPDAPAESGGAEFARAVTRMIEQVNSDQLDAARTIQQLAVEGKGSIHEAMVAITNAEGSFRLMMEIRNRLVLGINQLLESSR